LPRNPMKSTKKRADSRGVRIVARSRRHFQWSCDKPGGG
jgi:hypothetical protein